MRKIIIGVIVFIMFAGGVFYLNKKSYNKNLMYCFKGEVQDVRYDLKGFPYVRINSVTYYLSYLNWDFNHEIEKGDTLEKEEGNFAIKLVKRKNGKLLFFDKIQ